LACKRKSNSQQYIFTLFFADFGSAELAPSCLTRDFA
jgi:hypothetical protein